MQLTKKNLTPTNVQLILAADADLLQAAKQQALKALAKSMKLQGFREGKAPLAIVEKQADPERLQSEFLDLAVNSLYNAAIDQENLRPINPPKVTIKKFVPFETLEIEAEVEVVGEVKLADYKKIKLAVKTVTVTAKEIDEVIAQLRTRAAERKEVDRAAKDGDEVWIDFVGVDAKTKEPIKGGDGKDYPLILGSNTFIPGFEPELVGVKAGDEKTFTIAFPKDYGVKSLQGQKVTFTVTVKKVQEVVEPKLDDAFAATVGPFKNVENLKSDIEKELKFRKQGEADQAYTDELITKIAEKSTVALPDTLVNEQIDRIEQDQRQNLMYRGQTWAEYLEAEGLTEKTYREKNRPAAELRVKAGLVLSDIAEAEKITVTAAELDAQFETLKAQYTDPQMQAELAKPEARRSIASRLLTEKTVAKLKEYAS